MDLCVGQHGSFFHASGSYVFKQEHHAPVHLLLGSFNILWHSSGVGSGVGGRRMTVHDLLQLSTRTYLNLTIVFAFMLKVRDVWFTEA
jgi:hypothetical protein